MKKKLSFSKGNKSSAFSKSRGCNGKQLSLQLCFKITSQIVLLRGARFSFLSSLPGSATCIKWSVIHLEASTKFVFVSGDRSIHMLNGVCKPVSKEGVDSTS